MSFFIAHSTISVKICYCLCLMIFIFYFINKWKRTKIVFSPFNFQIIFFCFVMFVTSPFQYNYEIANNWSSISTSEYLLRLNEAYLVNLFGFSILGLTMIHYERQETNSKTFCRLMNFIYSNSQSKSMTVYCVMIGMVFIAYIAIKAHGFPIFNGTRFSTESAQFVFILLNSMVYCCGWYCVGGLSKKADIKTIGVLAILGFALLITGNRMPILKIMYAGFILIVSSRGRINYKTVFKQVKYVIVILFVGIAIIVARNGAGIVSFTEIINNYIIYGATFCDARDGARVLFGYHKMYSSPLHGKTYLAALLSFVPSSVSGIPILADIAEFRQVYSGGRWSTYTLFGITNHYGLRGGMFLPSYFNFGVIGIVIVAIVLGYWFGNCEKLFIRMIKHKDKYDFQRILFSYCFVSMLFELLYAPATFNSIWGYIVVLIILILPKGQIYLSNRSIEARDGYEE